MKKIAILFILLSMIILGCGKKEVVNNEVTEILFWQAMGGPLGDALTELVQQFNDTHPNIHVKSVNMGNYTALSQKLMASLQTGNQPDVAQAYEAWIANMLEGDVIVPIEEFINEDPNFGQEEMDDIYPVFINSNIMDGKLVSFPFNKSVRVQYYNKDILFQNDVDPNTPPKTWEELYEVAKKFTKKYNPNSPTMYGLAFYGRKSESLPMFWYQIFRSYGGTWWYDRPAFDSEPAMKALKWVVKVIKEGLVPPDISTYEYMEILGALQTGQVAMAVQWDAAYPTLRDKKASPLVWDKMGVAMVPGVWTPEGIRRAHSAHDQMLVINPNSEYKKVAFIFIAWATASPEGAKIYAMAGCSPPRKSILSDPEVLKKFPRFSVKLPGLDKWGYAEPALPDYPEMKDILNTYLAKAWALEIDPETALKKANQEIYEFLRSKGYYK